MSLLPQTRTHADLLYRQLALCGGDEYAVYALAALYQTTSPQMIVRGKRAGGILNAF